MLSIAQREGIRAIYDGNADRVANRTLYSLIDRDLVLPPNENEGYRLTPLGEYNHRRIMATGDGPEALKELLRF